ncbi:MAG: nitroreductase [Dehalococcoidales bacterium]|jgi:nitroreductase
MDLKEALRKRKSIRGYRRDTVPAGVIREILEIAVRAPSALNSQPWEFAVVTGEALGAIKDHNERMLVQGEAPCPDFPLKTLDGVYRERQVAVYAELCHLMGFEPEDRVAGARWRRWSFRFFEAPVIIVIYADVSLDTARTNFDLGLVSQSICLAALDYGLGTCLCLQAVSYPDKIREITGIPRSKKICVAIALGYPDTEKPANRIQSQREPVENITCWCGFGDQF